MLSLGKEILSRVLDDTDVVGLDREKYSWGLELIEEYINDVKELPPAQSEIIRCKDCKYRGGLSGFYCDIVEKVVGVDSFCSWAEKKTDE